MKRALLVGINNYKDQYIQDLGGCVNDVLNIRSILKEFFGFEDAGIHVLTDERATAEGIKDRLYWMVQASQDGDSTVFHFSGHGSQIRDRNGDELSDGMDELICPHDMNWDRPETFITDDELGKIFDEGGWNLSENQKMEIFLDCCHSGTGIRALNTGGRMYLIQGDKPVWGEKRNRYTPPPMDILCRSMDAKKLPIERLFLNNQYLSDPVLWSGCRANQTSADAFIDNNYNGAFTWHLCNAVRKFTGMINRGAIIQEVRESLAGGNFDQVPQLETKHEGKLSTGLFE